MGFLFKIIDWASRIRLDDPVVLSNIDDVSDALNAIRQGMGW